MHETQIRVRYSETDQMGVVYHANYLIWMEVARVETVRRLGVNYRELERQEGLFLLVVEAQCRYLSPARYDQEVAIRSEIAEVNARMIQFRYEINDAESRRLLAKGMTKHMWLNRGFKPAKLPIRYLEILRGDDNKST